MENTNSNSEVVMGGSQSHVASSRWNPTKEQLRILESLYKQGIRTPTAEEIQQITARLSVYGHIEGKNVFYWFQNHKARQRQKQKQESIAFYRHAPPPQPFFPHHPVCTNARCAPYFMPQAQNEMGFYPQHPEVVVPVGYMRNPAAEKAVPTSMSSMICTNDQLVYEGMQQHRISGCNLSYNNQETLDLFPLHPTGILEGKTTTTTTDQVSSSSLASVSADSSTDTASASPDINQDYASPPNQPFFDFFATSGQGS